MVQEKDCWGELLEGNGERLVVCEILVSSTFIAASEA